MAACAAVMAMLVWWVDHPGPVTHPPGILAPAQPLQEPLDGTQPPSWRKGTDTIVPLARFSLTARVLSRADYSSGRGSRLAPVDLALGWGRMSDSAVLSDFSISQGGRFYAWRADTLPIPYAEVVRSSANMHMIPATPAVRAMLGYVRVGDIVTLDGYLVQVSGIDGFHWVSSLRRTDTGDGACELVWVRNLTIAAH